MSTNIFKRLSELLPRPPLLVGKVLAHHSDDTSTVELPISLGQISAGSNVATGSLIRPRGRTVPVGGMAFVRAGVIETEAPDTPPLNIPVGRVVPPPPVPIVLPTVAVFSAFAPALSQRGGTYGNIPDRDADRAAIAPAFSVGLLGIVADFTAIGHERRDYLIGTVASAEYAVGRAAGQSQMDLIFEGTTLWAGLLLLEDLGKNCGFFNVAGPYVEWEYSFGTLRFDGLVEGVAAYPMPPHVPTRVGALLQWIISAGAVTPRFSFYAQRTTADGFSTELLPGYPSIFLDLFAASSIPLPPSAYDAGTGAHGVAFLWDAATRALEVWAVDVVTGARVSRLWPDLADPAFVTTIDGYLATYVPVNNPAVGHICTRTNVGKVTVLD